MTKTTGWMSGSDRNHLPSTAMPRAMSSWRPAAPFWSGSGPLRSEEGAIGLQIQPDGAFELLTSGRV